MSIRSACFASAITAAFMALVASAADRSYSELFQEALAKQQSVIIENVNLVDTNNLRPTITNVPMPFSKFQEGEVGGIRLGMTMSEVVTAWGKPTRLFRHCGVGPRFCNRPGRFVGDVSLFFKENRLVLITIVGETAKHLSFDNGLSGQHGKADYERRLGVSVIREPDQAGGQIGYRTGPVRFDFLFGRDRASPASEHLCWVALRNEAETKGEQDTAPTGDSSAPSRSPTAPESRHR